MSAPPPLHRHQSSLEGVIDFSAEAPLEINQRNDAKRRFYRIIEHFGATGTIDNVPPQYEPPRLVRYTYEYALSEESRDNFLRAFFRAMALSLTGQNNDLDNLEDLRSLFFGFANYLLDNFFLPIKASTKKTPQPSPAYHSAVERVQGGVQSFIGTPDRLSQLRGACLVRDRHRCVVTRYFDHKEADRRIIQDGDDARDDDGTLFSEDTVIDELEVAHILPHSLMKADVGHELNPSKQAALGILNMFDSGIVHLIDGANIDRPSNAITLTSFIHAAFGDFKIFFESIPNQPHTYQIQTFYHRRLNIRNLDFPITRTLYLTNDRSIDPPSPRLLAVHRAIAHILRLSGAGEYIDKLLRDMNEESIQADGSTELDRMLRLGLGGWLNKPVY
ncbi:hypothetical protein NUW58_g7812 [Xylaria curta]|uniref:Uncharacterized protein n=1 Tax=Xylaria curta TaxID=42375 RepID=A0ACC1NF21_9PEZI|nr:hypothetical protein NUW58_g7812 [Xylaria curta]